MKREMMPSSLTDLPAVRVEPPRWYVLQTKPHQERRVLAHLARRAVGVRPFFPKIEVVRRRSGRKVARLEPLFPSYLFVCAQMDAPTWNAVRWTPGARRILGVGERPVEVPDELLETIRDRCGPLGFVRVGVQLRLGARVRVLTGPFEGLVGIFQRPTSRRDRVRVLLNILGRVTPLELDVLDVEPV